MEFSEACSDVWYILESLKPNELCKIPKKLLETIHILKIDDYTSKIDLNYPLENQELSEATIGLLSFIYNNYLGTIEEKEEYERTYKECLKSINNTEEYKIQFKKIDEQIEQESNKKDLIQYKGKDNIFFRIINKIKKILRLV